MTEISSLVPIIKEEIEKERQQTFEAAKEKDKDRTIVPDASLPDTQAFPSSGKALSRCASQVLLSQ